MTQVAPVHSLAHEKGKLPAGHGPWIRRVTKCLILVASKSSMGAPRETTSRVPVAVGRGRRSCCTPFEQKVGNPLGPRVGRSAGSQSKSRRPWRWSRWARR